MLTCLLLFAAITPPMAAQDEFHFVVLGDSQFHDPAAFNRMIDDVKLLKPAFVIQVGDMIAGYHDDPETVVAEWQRFKHQIEPLAPIPFMPVVGNHDIFNAKKKPDKKLEAIFKQVWGATNYQFTYRNSHFIILNSDAPGRERAIGKEQFRWLRKKLANNTASEHTFVFMHRPPFTLKSSEKLHALFVQHSVDFVIYGHHHHYHYREQDGVNYVMVSSTANSGLEHDLTGSFDHFAQVSVRDTDVSLAIVRSDSIEALNYSDPSDNYDLFAFKRDMPNEVKMTKIGSNQWSLSIPLNNPGPRILTAYVACKSDDDRWQFDPASIDPIELGAESRQKLTLAVSFDARRVPEGEVYCDLTVPFQTSRGNWVYDRHRVTAAQP